MRRFAQSKDKPIVPENEPSYEKAILDEEKKNIEDFYKSQKKVIDFCKELTSVGLEFKKTAGKLPAEQFLLSMTLSSLGDKFIQAGTNVNQIIQAKTGAELGFDVVKNLAAIIQKPSTGPGLKRNIPLIGDLINFELTANLTAKDYTEPLYTLSKPYKCNKIKDHKVNAPIWKNLGLSLNFDDHPELLDQHREQAEAISKILELLSIWAQNIEALSAWLVGILGGPAAAPAVVIIRLLGGAISLALQVLSALISPNFADITQYSSEGFEGGGIDPQNPFAKLNKIPGLSEFIKIYESKPIAGETQQASEQRVQNFILEDIIKKGQEDDGVKSSFDYAYIKDTLGNLKAMTVGSTWQKWGITITGIYDDHVEYKDKYNKKYSIRKNTPSFSFVNTKGFADPKAFIDIMTDAANLRTSGVNGDVTKLLSKKSSDIISLMYQLKNKYPWIGDSKNAKWINLQSDILSHLIREPKERKPMPKPVATLPRPTAVPNLREISLENYKQKYFREDQSQLIPERRGSAVKVKLREVMDAIKSGTLSQMNWDKWSDIGKQAIIEEAIDRLEKAGYGIPGVYIGTTWAPPISKDILNQLSPKYRPGYKFKPPP
jgi:hypothetical protein